MSANGPAIHASGGPPPADRATAARAEHRSGGVDRLGTRRPVAYTEQVGRKLAEDDVDGEA